MKRYIKAAITNVLDERRDIQEEIAGDPTTSSDILDALADSNDRNICILVANNPGTSPETLQKLSNSSVLWVKVGVVNNPNVSLETYRIIQSPKVTDDILFQMVKNGIGDDIFDIAASRKASADTLTYIYDHTDDDDVMLLFRLVQNPNTPISIIENLAEYPNEYVRRRAIDRLKGIRE